MKERIKAIYDCVVNGDNKGIQAEVDAAWQKA